MEDTMKRKRFTEEQIIGVLKEADAGLPIKELVRKYGVTEQTYYRWKSKFGGMEVNEAKRLRGLEDENRRLKHLVADLSSPCPRSSVRPRTSLRSARRGGPSPRRLPRTTATEWSDRAFDIRSPLGRRVDRGAPF